MEEKLNMQNDNDEAVRMVALIQLQYEDFKGYFVEFDLAQRWMNRTDNDLSMLDEILTKLKVQPSLQFTSHHLLHTHL